MRVKCDMDRFAVSLLRSSKATFTLLLVAPRAWVGRHAAAPWATGERDCRGPSHRALAEAERDRGGELRPEEGMACKASLDEATKLDPYSS
jgi:hypothetical protein